MKTTGNFSMQEFLNKLNEESNPKEDNSKVSDEGMIIPDTNKKTYDWLKSEFQKGKVEVSVIMSSSKFDPGYSTEGAKDFKPELKTSSGSKIKVEAKSTPKVEKTTPKVEAKVTKKEPKKVLKEKNEEPKKEEKTKVEESLNEYYKDEQFNENEYQILDNIIFPTHIVNENGSLEKITDIQVKQRLTMDYLNKNDFYKSYSEEEKKKLIKPIFSIATDHRAWLDSKDCTFAIKKDQITESVNVIVPLNPEIDQIEKITEPTLNEQNKTDDSVLTLDTANRFYGHLVPWELNNNDLAIIKNLRRKWFKDRAELYATYGKYEIEKAVEDLTKKHKVEVKNTLWQNAQKLQMNELYEDKKRIILGAREPVKNDPNANDWAIFKIAYGKKSFVTKLGTDGEWTDNKGQPIPPPSSVKNYVKETNYQVKYSDPSVKKFTYEQTLAIIRHNIGVEELWGVVNSSGYQRTFNWRIKYPEKYPDQWK
jgi:hypothetical protein